jgi:hypothetical protein
VRYFTARGLAPADAEFPLVAVVFSDAGQLFRYARAQGVRLTAGTLGYYSLKTNRILLYDVTRGQDASRDEWQVNAETILHEAAHQAAYNTGIHSRFAETPRWLVEGMGTMFEAPGVWDQRGFPLQRQRINRAQLDAFRDLLDRRQRRWTLQEFLETDEWFSRDPLAAYAESWSLTFFLAETRPREYWQLLRRTASRPGFQSYSAADRLNDVRQSLGEELELLEAHYLRFIRDLP